MPPLHLLILHNNVRMQQTKLVIRQATQSNGVCTIELSRESPSVQLLGHKFNEITPQEVRYGTVGNNNVLMIFEFTLLESEVNPVAKSFENNGVTVTAIHNHWLFEHPILYYMHAEKNRRS